MNLRALTLVALGAVTLACKFSPPPAPFLSEEELAVAVVRPSQSMALNIAQTCEPIAAVRSGNDHLLRQTAYARGANLAEVLYDGRGSTAVIHRCPLDFDPWAKGGSAGTAATGKFKKTETIDVTIH